MTDQWSIKARPELTDQEIRLEAVNAAVQMLARSATGGGQVDEYRVLTMANKIEAYIRKGEVPR